MKEYEANVVLVFITIAILFSLIMAFSETAAYLPYHQ